MYKITVFMLIAPFPWCVRRWLLQQLFGYQIHPTAKIGFSWIFPEHLVMEAHSCIGHLNVCKGLDLVVLKQYATITKGNWISGFHKKNTSYFSNQKDRLSQLILEEHVGISENF